MDTAQLQLKALLRGDMPSFVVSLLVLFAGLAALAVQLLRRKSKDRTLLWFGLFASLYGVRSLVRLALVQTLFDLPRFFWNWLASLISNVIVTPALIFFENIYGKGWRSSMRWLLWVQAMWAVAAIVADAATGRPGNAPDPSTLLIIVVPVLLVAGYVLGYRPPQASGTAIIFAGGATFLITVIVDHLRSLGLTPWQLSIEPFGFMANLGCLGYVALRRFVATEQQLVAVEEEMRSASRIQAAILPRSVPAVPGMQIAVRYLPMTAVAGDFYDFLIAGPDSTGILVADVTGHGVPAALIASMVKVAFAAQSAHAADPAQVIAALNQVMCKTAQGQFTTAGYLFVDMRMRRALYAAAGHPPLLVWRSADRSIHEFRENGLLMGVRAAETYASVSISLEPGDRLLLYTDGIPEAANAAEEFFGSERLNQFIEEHDGMDAGAFADALVKTVSEWSGNGTQYPQTDDITLVVVDV